MKGIDCNTKITPALAEAIKQKGYEFVIRYVGRLKQATFDIDKKEVDIILSAGLKLGIVQHSPGKPGLLPSKDLGTIYGSNAAGFAKGSGYKESCIIYLDLEDVNKDYSKRQQDIIDYCNAWYDQVLKAGYVPGIYVGFNTFLTGDQLYTKLKFQHYWKSLSNVPDVTKRGYEMIQTAGDPIDGMAIDVNTVTGDKLGNSPVFMAPVVNPAVELVTFLNSTTPKVINDTAMWIKKATADKDIFNLLTNMKNYIEQGGK